MTAAAAAEVTIDETRPRDVAMAVLVAGGAVKRPLASKAALAARVPEKLIDILKNKIDPTKVDGRKSKRRGWIFLSRVEVIVGYPNV